MGSVTRRVVTFYSFKGGVGRTFALCDVAVYLVRWGYRVLCVDLDLEAPGLTRYFNGWLQDNNAPGMLEILDAWSKDASDEAISLEAILPVNVPGTDGRLGLVKSGRAGDDYVRRLHAVDWQHLFDEQRAGRRLEALRERWLDQFDFVLIDSRTGWSDVGEICTIHLPDILVALFAPNDQSLDGALAVADASKAGVARLPLDRAPLRIVPVLSRVDKDEYEAQQQWTERLLAKASRFLKDWDPEEETPPDVLAQLVVPYVPYWSYGERLAALRTERVSSLSVGRAHETLAALLAHSLLEAGRLLRQRESYVEEAAIGKSVTAPMELTVEYDFYISYSTAGQNVARDLADALRKRGANVFFDQWVLRPGDLRTSILSNAQQQSRVFVVLVDKTIGAAQEEELSFPVLRAERGEARFVPIALSGLDDLPSNIRQFQPIIAPRTLAGIFLLHGVDVEALAETLLPLALRR